MQTGAPPPPTAAAAAAGKLCKLSYPRPHFVCQGSTVLSYVVHYSTAEIVQEEEEVQYSMYAVYVYILHLFKIWMSIYSVCTPYIAPSRRGDCELDLFAAETLLDAVV